MFALAELEDVVPLVRAGVQSTPQYAWPLLKARTGVEVVVKHENHTPIGAFKVRGGIVYFDRLKRERPQVRAIVTATRGNHGQSVALAGQRFGVPVTIVVPFQCLPMVAQGVKLIGKIDCTKPEGRNATLDRRRNCSAGYRAYACSRNTNAAPSRSGFCNFWNAVCLRTGGRQDVCTSRHTNCLSNGCFFFNNPRPRCENNAFDLDLMRPENRGKGCPDCRK